MLEQTHEDAARDMANELDEIIERLTEIADNWAPEYGFRAVEHKLQEAIGPLQSASDAAVNYHMGLLEPRDD